MTLESILTFLSNAGGMIFWLLAVGVFLYLAGWVTHRILRGETVLPIGGCLGVVVQYGFVLFAGASIGAYFGQQVREEIIDAIWVQTFFALTGASIAFVTFINFNRRKE